MPVMFSCTETDELEVPATGNVTVKVCPVTIGGVLTQVEPSKVADPSGANPDTWPGRADALDRSVKKVTCGSRAFEVQVTPSPA